MIANLIGPDIEMKPGFKARKLRVGGGEESLNGSRKSGTEQLKKSRVILEFIMKLRALIVDSDCLDVQ